MLIRSQASPGALKTLQSNANRAPGSAKFEPTDRVDLQSPPPPEKPQLSQRLLAGACRGVSWGIVGAQVAAIGAMVGASVLGVVCVHDTLSIVDHALRATRPESLWLEALPLSKTAIGLVSLPLLGGTSGLALGLIRGDLQAARGELGAVRAELTRVKVEQLNRRAAWAEAEGAALRKQAQTLEKG